MQKNKFLNTLPVVIVLIAILSLFSLNSGSSSQSYTYSQLQETLKNETIQESVISIGSNVVNVRGTYENDEGRLVSFSATAPATSEQIDELLDQLKDSKISIVDADASDAFLEVMYSVVPLVLVIIMGVWMMNRMGGSNSANAKAFEFGKSRAKLETKSKVRFADVAGCDEEKQEMAEIIDYLKYPAKFKKMGARIPKGVLLSGHPGTGKTLLAKAVAGEANVPFYSISGSDFVEMFVTSNLLKK